MPRDKLTALFVHKDFPSQFQGLVSHFLKRPDTTVAAVCEESASASVSGVITSRYPRQTPLETRAHPFAAMLERYIRRGAAAREAALRLKASGVEPDIIYAHPGWGEALFLAEVFPRSRRVAYCEFYYRMEGADVGFDPEFPTPPLLAPVLTVLNVPTLLALNDCHAAVSPTRWQHGGFPPHWRERIRVLHEGVDTELVKPDPAATLELPCGTALRAGDEVVTFIARTLEPYRGFHTFMRCLPELLARRPGCTVLVVGRETRGYGPNPPEGQGSWAAKYLRENPVDLGRVRFLGTLPYPLFVKALQISACHVYLTYPFVLSWSLIEALAAGCLVVASDTAPLAEVIDHGRNGLLVDFFDPLALAGTIARVLAAPRETASMRREARRTAVERYDRRSVCLPAHLELAARLLGKEGRP